MEAKVCSCQFLGGRFNVNLDCVDLAEQDLSLLDDAEIETLQQQLQDMKDQVRRKSQQ